jgi:hypothetical protein
MQSAHIVLDDLETLVSPAGGSDAAAGLPCAAVRAVIVVLSTMRK